MAKAETRGRIRYYLRCFYPFLLTLTVILIAYAWSGVFPFGEKASLREDAVYQYAGFFGWYSRVLHGDSSLIFSFSKSLGGQTFGLFTYYLASPLNILSIFFSPADMPKFMTILYAVKLALMSTTTYVFLKYRFDIDDHISIISSSAYSLASCNFIAGANIMWLDAAILLPIVCLSISKLVQEAKPLPLIATTTYMVIANWYSAYMVCLFSILWTIFELVDRHNYNIKFLIKSAASYMACMLLALGISAFLFVPTARYLIASGTAGASTISSDTSFFTNSIFTLIGKYYIGDTSIWPDANGLCGSFYVTGFVLIGLIGFYITSTINITRRISLFLISALLIISELSPKLSIIWTGFSRADSYIPRFHFLFVFVACICFSLWMQERIEDSKHTKLAIKSCLVSTAIIVLYLLSYNYFHPYQWQSLLAIQITMLIFSCIFICLLIRVKHTGDNVVSTKKHYTSKTILSTSILIYACMILLFIGENSYYVKRVYNNDNSTELINVNSYSQYMNAMNKLISTKGSDDLKGVRTEHVGASTRGFGNSTFPTGENMALGIGGISHYSSVGDDATKQLLGHLGYNGVYGTRGITYYNSQLLLMDSVFSLGRVVSNSKTSITTGLSEVASTRINNETLLLLENKDAASIGFLVPRTIKDIAWGNNRFNNQNLFVNSITGLNLNYYSRQAEVNKIDSQTFSLKVTKTGPLYVDFNVNERIHLYLNDKQIQDFASWEFDSNIIYLGEYNEGDIVKLRVETDSGNPISNDQVEFETLDLDNYHKAMGILAENSVKLVKLNDRGTTVVAADSEKNGKVLFTIPSSEGWAIKVNDKYVPYEIVDGMISVDIPQGKSTISLEYHVPKLTTGILITIVSVVLSIPYCLFFRNKRTETH